TEKLSSGKTIIMVSHQLDLLKSLCNKGVYLKAGKIKASGSIEDVTEKYILDSDTPDHNDLLHRRDRIGSGKVRVITIQATDFAGKVMPVLQSGQSIIFAVTLRSAEPVLRNVEIRLDVFDKMGQSWFVLNNNISNGMIESCPGKVVLQCKVPKLPLSEGTFSMNVSLNVNYEKCDFVQHAFEFKVVRGDFYKTGRLPSYARGVLVEYNWDVQ
ncbi:MAG TPA: Wzt carbohydrate-binding domain-containing protein, partial [Saprospiraceae bacterium]|nr:Wzt carbohydrate-binding domain-containing protein [Saprospiraceae bacterium]